jgi:hypothetical protein
MRPNIGIVSNEHYCITLKDGVFQVQRGETLITRFAAGDLDEVVERLRVQAETQSGETQERVAIMLNMLAVFQAPLPEPVCYQKSEGPRPTHGPGEFI